eukprot:TRINITY_DN2856_c0_g1_i2.p1 TRINITY_DN2856_c0_g1~~TRINITY_DN2856_c0_g1_i2.p1  ORF type:complete len:132 (-),score=54.93 TRINITY_DN2856_c0_g1_i2:155-550(-)
MKEAVVSTQSTGETKEETIETPSIAVKGILVKPGHKREKKTGGVVVAEAGPEKKPGQVKKYDLRKIEGREGAVVRNRSNSSVLKPRTSSDGFEEDDKEREREKDGEWGSNNGSLVLEDEGSRKKKVEKKKK